MVLNLFLFMYWYKISLNLDKYFLKKVVSETIKLTIFKMYENVAAFTSVPRCQN